MSDVQKDPCRFCKDQGPHKIILRPDGLHYADVRCAVCGKHLGFAKKPDSDPTKYRRPQQHRDLVGEYSRGFCEMCLTPKAQLPKGQTLEAQHVIEYENGGGPERENIWILCTGCHRFVHWVRTYHGGNLRPQFTELVK